jgi:hypothetical protein
MMRASRKTFVEGTVLEGEKAGYRVRVEDDYDNTGGFLIIFMTPDQPGMGGDYWVEAFEDISKGLEQLGLKMQWDDPLDCLRR